MKTTLAEMSRLLKDEAVKKATVAQCYGTVKAINPDGSYEVALGGGNATTTCVRNAGANVGDTVLVTILSNGQCVVASTLGGDKDALEAKEGIERQRAHFWHDDYGAHVQGEESGFRTDLDGSGMNVVDATSEEDVRIASYTTEKITSLATAYYMGAGINPGASQSFSLPNDYDPELGLSRIRAWVTGSTEIRTLSASDYTISANSFTVTNPYAETIVEIDFIYKKSEYDAQVRIGKHASVIRDAALVIGDSKYDNYNVFKIDYNGNVFTRGNIEVNTDSEFENGMRLIGCTEYKNGAWTTRLYNDGTFEAFFKSTGGSMGSVTAWGGVGCWSNVVNVTLPALAPGVEATSIRHVDIGVFAPSAAVTAVMTSLGANTFGWRYVRFGSTSTYSGITYTYKVEGTWS